MKRASIIIPTYNEEGNIQQLVEQVFDVSSHVPNWVVDVVIVDSNSPDGTGKVVESLIQKYPHLHLLKTEKEGLGKAYMKGFKIAIEKLQPYLLFEMDADLSHDPKLIPAFLEKIEKGADFVIGSRYIKGGSIPADWGLYRKVLSSIGNLIIRFGFMKLSISDWTSGYRAIKVWIVKDAFTHTEKYAGYVFQVALLDRAIAKHARIAEVPLKFIDRKSGISKIDSVQYIVQTLWYVFTHSSFIKFVIVGLLGFVIDFGFAYAFINLLKIAKAPANMLSAEVAIVCNFFINNFWSFRHKKIAGGFMAYVGKFFIFNFVSLGSILIQGGGMFLALKFLGDTKILLLGGLSSWILYKVLIIAFLIIPYSYVLYNKVVWKNK
ncbi:glycosyltransferase [Candidatus Roizmanbacteria bacterium]|nr:glycosyltransferase [Candidatus Roizmanbacteria bacterium]